MFIPGSVVRMSAGDARPLIEQGILKQVEMYTLCRIDPLADGSCAVVTESQAAALNSTVTQIPEFETASKDTKQAGKVLADSKNVKKSN